MKAVSLVAAALGIAGVSCVAMTLGPMSKHKAVPESMATRAPVLVELFTSEGCSSCPPADDLLARLQKEQPVDGAVVIPLGEHVDYWDGAAWKDPFSSAQFTSRQSAYVRALRLKGPYTPQMVVDGQAEFVGSDEEAAVNSIAAASANHKVRIELSAKAAGPKTIALDVSTKSAVTTSSQETDDVFVAVAENNLSSQVRGGENGGRHLSHTAVVRSLTRFGSVIPGTPFTGSFQVQLDPRWKKENLNVVAFIQGRKSGRILGVGMVSVPR